MKKLIVLVVALAVGLAFAAYAGDEVKTKEKIKTPEGKEVIKTDVKVKTGEKDTEIKDKTAKGKEDLKIVEKKGETDVTDVTKNKKGEVWKETVKFQKIDQDTDYIYVMKDDKVVRLKHKLSDSMKKDMLKKKNGDAITVTSTYPLTNEQLAVVLEAK